MLKIENLCVDRDNKKILENVSLTVKKDEIFSIIGPNGSGKSTLAYTLIGGYKPSAGRIFLKGENITNMSIYEHAKIGITLAWQEPARFEGLKIKDYLSLGKENNPDKALGMVNMNPSLFLNRALDNTLSGGERKRIELASIITMMPKLVILDEPDSGIDFVSLDDLIRVIEEIKKQGVTVLLITHREDVARCSDRCALLCDGKVIKEGDAWEITKFFRKECKVCPTKKYSLKHGGMR